MLNPALETHYSSTDDHVKWSKATKQLKKQNLVLRLFYQLLSEV